MTPPGDLRGRVAIVTGSGRNIGRAIAVALARAGAAVVVNGHRDAAALDAVVAEIEAEGGQAMACLADVSRDTAVGGMVSATVRRFGRLDIAVSNVGVRPHTPLPNISPEEWERVMATNRS